MRRPLAPRLLVFALVTTLAAACGSGTPSQVPASSTPVATPQATPSPTPRPTPEPTSAADAARDELIEAALATVATGTVRVRQDVVFHDSSLVPDGTTMTAAGQAAFDAPKRSRLQADLTALGFGEMTMIIDDHLLYVQGTVVEELVGDKWLLVDLESGHPATAQFGSLASGQNDVSVAVMYLLGATDDIAIEDDQLAGRPVRHFTTTVDLAIAREIVPEAYAESLEDNIAALRVGGIERVFAAEAWVDEDGLVIRAIYVYELARARGGGSMVTHVDFSDHGDPIALGIPPAANVIDLADLVPR
jgi:hypothetical protein